MVELIRTDVQLQRFHVPLRVQAQESNDVLTGTPDIFYRALTNACLVFNLLAGLSRFR